MHILYIITYNYVLYKLNYRILYIGFFRALASLVYYFFYLNDFFFIFKIGIHFLATARGESLDLSHCFIKLLITFRKPRSSLV